MRPVKDCLKELAFGLKIHFISKIDQDDGNVCENVHGFEKTIKESDILAESKKIGKLLLKKELGRVPPGAPGGNAVRARNESSQEKEAASKQDNRVDGGKRKYMRDSAQSVMKKCKLTSFTNQPLFFQHTLFHDSAVITEIVYIKNLRERGNFLKDKSGGILN